MVLISLVWKGNNQYFFFKCEGKSTLTEELEASDGLPGRPRGIISAQIISLGCTMIFCRDPFAFGKDTWRPLKTPRWSKLKNKAGYATNISRKRVGRG